MSGAAIHILLVEDNPDHAELLRRNLESFPLPICLHHVEDGEAALDYIFGRNHFASRSQFPPPDVILLDLRLPRVDGMDILKLVKNHPETRQLPVVVLTTSDAERDVAEAIECRADKFLTKPVDSQTLLQILLGLGFDPVNGVRLGQRGESVKPARA